MFYLVHSTYIRTFYFLNLNVGPSFFQTFLALNIPQPQPDNYKLFTYYRLTVVVGMWSYTEKSHKFCIVIFKHSITP